MTPGREVRFEVDGLTYAGLEWGQAGQPLVLALHGWLDNALSFYRLAPLLNGYRVIALDLSGHGYSSHRSPDATYQIWDDLPQLDGIVEALAEPDVIVLGHSRGASIATLLAVVLKDRCRSLVLIDGLLPVLFNHLNAGQQLRHFVRDRRKYMGRSDRWFDSVEEFAQRRNQYGFTADSARDLAPRALEATDDGYRLLNDPRLFGASAQRLDSSRRREIYSEIEAPVLSIVADTGLLAREKAARTMLEEAGSCINDFRSCTIAGSHHLHMEEGSAEKVAQRINQFLATGQ